MFDVSLVQKKIKKNKVLNKLIYFDVIGSTNNYLKENKHATGTVVLAGLQEAGMGKYGAKWVSPAGGLWFSFVIKKKIKKPYIYIILVSVAIIKALKNIGIKAQIRWPNDILVNSAKLCGVLIENDFYSGRLVVGVGINVNNKPPVVKGVKTTSVSKVLAKKSDIEALFVSLIKNINANIGRTKDRTLVNEWVKNQTDIIGKYIKIAKGSKIIEGKISKVRNDGSIEFVDSKGIELVISGDVFFF